MSKKYVGCRESEKYMMKKYVLHKEESRKNKTEKSCGGEEREGKIKEVCKTN